MSISRKGQSPGTLLNTAESARRCAKAFSSEVDTASCEENASKQKLEPGSDSIRTGRLPAVLNTPLTIIVLSPLTGDVFLGRIPELAEFGR
jgi:hypothetical protein